MNTSTKKKSVKKSIENRRRSQIEIVAGRLGKTLLDLDEISKEMREIRDDLEQEINETRWIDYRLVWDEDAQKHFLAEWLHDHLISLGLKPDKQRNDCLSLVFKWVNHVREMVPRKKEPRQIFMGACRKLLCLLLVATSSFLETGGCSSRPSFFSFALFCCRPRFGDELHAPRSRTIQSVEDRPSQTPTASSERTTIKNTN